MEREEEDSELERKEERGRKADRKKERKRGRGRKKLVRFFLKYSFPPTPPQKNLKDKMKESKQNV